MRPRSGQKKSTSKPLTRCLLRGEGRPAEVDRAEVDLQLRVGEAEGEFVQHLAQWAHARLAGMVVQGEAERLRVDQVALVGVVHGALDSDRVEFARHVDQGLDWAGHGQVVHEADLRRRQRRTAANEQAGATDVLGPAHGEVDPSRLLGADPPERGGAAMAERGAVAEVGLGGEVSGVISGRGGQDGSRPTPAPVQVGPADRVDPPHHRMEASVVDPVLNRRCAEPERQQLHPRHDPMLAGDQPPSVSVSRSRH
jgi:hypothetical protein